MRFLTIALTLILLVVSCKKVDVQEVVNNTQQLIKDGKFVEAETALTPCLEAGKGNPRIYVLLALATAGQNKVELTHSYAAKALPLFDEKPDAEAMTHLGQAYLNIKDYTKALEVLELSNSIAPDSEYTVALLIEAEMKSFSSLRSYALRNKYLKLAEKFPSLRDSSSYLVIRAVTNALGPNLNRSFIAQSLSQAYLKEKNSPAVLLNLGFIYDQIYRNPKRAISYYESYLKAVAMLPPEQTQMDKVKKRIIMLSPTTNR